ncbi:hybrid sensor histidine kinase/response regulator transcription factor [Mangrovibacterium lignilyticum]|uniref:hybrid sensor histidine kinase/response regulator transcription factor n=1 Tax=Mangrovibacterium lignilyticum TaxID=2668052 RepID=UPI0013D74090|nr:hybrid sensor histidine kinase/response regulator transcription factor [Mangrovibacterium lignilyticum]
MNRNRPTDNCPRLFVLVFFLWLIVFNCQRLSAQHIRFDHFDTRKGLSQNNIYSLLVDSTGYIWIGTLEGITRFDGNKFETYRSFPSQRNTLKGNFINKLSACPNGNIWVHIRSKGLNLYNAQQEKFQLYNDTCFYPSNISELTSMVSRSDSLLWFTDNSSLYQYNLNKNQTTKIETPFPNGRVEYAGSQNLLYWGNGGLLFTDNKQQGALISKSPVRILSRVYNDSLCVLFSDSLRLLNVKNRVITSLKPNKQLDQILRSNTIYSAAGYNNEIWLGLNDGLALITLEDKQIKAISRFSYDAFNNYSFHGKDASNLVFDKNGNLWIGTSKYGINLYDRRKNLFNHHQISVLSKSDQEIDPVRAICKTRDGKTWTGFDRLGVVKIQPGNSQVLYSEIHFPNNEVKPLENIRSLYEDSQGNLWIGSSRGLCMYNKKRDRIESLLLLNERNSISNGWNWQLQCYFMKEFTPGKLTITSPQGIGIVDLENLTLQIISMPSNYITESIRSLVKDSRSNYWFIADNRGLCKLSKDGSLRYFTHEKDSLTDNKLYTLEFINDTLWIGSNNGLMAFDVNKEKVVASYFETDGLSNNLVYSIIQDTDHLWMSTNRGISRLRLADHYIESFLPEDLFMDDAFFKDNNGIIYFGGYDGFISFNPKDIYNSPVSPKLIISELYINNRKIEVGQTVDDQLILSKSLQYLDAIQMSYSTNSFSLNFDAFPFNFPDDTYFRYRFKGLSSNWILTAKHESRAVFANLTPGEYTFEVEASHDKQNWSEPKHLAIAIIPPFYLTMWFKILLIVIVIAVVVTIFKFRIYTIKKWNLQLETQIREQTNSIEEQKNKIIAQKEKMVELSNQLHEADQAKLKFYTNISHEFRTPLTIIMGNIESLREQGVNQFVLANIKRSSDRLFRLVNQFIDLRKYDQGELKLEVSNFDIVSFVKEIADSFKELALRKNINIDLLNPQERIFVWLDKDKTDKIIYNLLSNAIKYTDAGGSVFVNLMKNEDELIIKITDTGCGISETEQHNIFKRFYRSDKVATNTEGHGVGLALVNALVELQKGSIECVSKESDGTTFRLSFKFGKSHFKESELQTGEPKTLSHATIPPPNVNLNNLNQPGEEILIVEDNPELMDYLISLLGSVYRVKSASNGKEALKLIDENIPDLIITDLMMPVMDGITLSKTLKTKMNTRFIPIIILSAKTDEDSKIEGYKINVDDYIEKPFNPNLLLSKIQSVLNTRGEIRKNIAQFSANQQKEMNQGDKLLMEKILLLLENNFANPDFNADILGNLLNMSRVTFYRRMKKLNGEGPGELIRKYRLQKAASILQGGNKTSTEVSSEVGFQSISHFRKSFKEQYGVSPSKFR